jgi:hypothetical protein
MFILPPMSRLWSNRRTAAASRRIAKIVAFDSVKWPCRFDPVRWRTDLAPPRRVCWDGRKYPARK